MSDKRSEVELVPPKRWPLVLSHLALAEEGFRNPFTVFLVFRVFPADPHEWP